MKFELQATVTSHEILVRDDRNEVVGRAILAKGPATTQLTMLQVRGYSADGKLSHPCVCDLEVLRMFVRASDALG